MKQKKKQNQQILIWLLTVALFAGGGAWWFKEQEKTSSSFSGAAQGPRLSGENIFAKYCASCHGDQAVGENPLKVAGGQKPGGGYWAPALNGTAHAWHHPPDALFQTVKEGSIAED